MGIIRQPDVLGAPSAPLNLELFAPGGLRETVVDIPECNQLVTISMPVDFDQLLDRAKGDPEQNLPYWAEIWPSGIALGAYIFQHPESVRGIRAVELGCGLGVTAIAAMRRGAMLTVTDYATEALALCAANCVANHVAIPTQLQMNWRNPGDDFLALIEAGVHLLLAADVLYEERDVMPLVELVEASLPTDGELWLAEPGRRPAASFMKEITARGWHSIDTSYAGPWPDPEDNRKGVSVTVHRIARLPSRSRAMN